MLSSNHNPLFSTKFKHYGGRQSEAGANIDMQLRATYSVNVSSELAAYRLK